MPFRVGLLDDSRDRFGINGWRHLPWTRCQFGQGGVIALEMTPTAQTRRSVDSRLYSFPGVEHLHVEAGHVAHFARDEYQAVLQRGGGKQAVDGRQRAAGTRLKVVSSVRNGRTFSEHAPGKDGR